MVSLSNHHDEVCVYPCPICSSFWLIFGNRPEFIQKRLCHAARFYQDGRLVILFQCAVRPVRAAYNSNIIVYDQYLIMGNTVFAIVIHRDAVLFEQFIRFLTPSFYFLTLFTFFPKWDVLIKDNRHSHTTPMGADEVVDKVVFPTTIVFWVDIGHVHDTHDGFPCSNQCLMNLWIIVSIYQRYDIVRRQTKGRRGVKETENNKNDDKDFHFLSL